MTCTKEHGIQFAPSLSNLGGKASLLNAPARQVLLFSGHMVDAPNRPKPRFPASAEPAAAAAIAKALTDLNVGPQDAAYCQAAAGGDLLFLEACQRRGVACHILLPFDLGLFIQRSVLHSTNGPNWEARFHTALSHAKTTVRAMPAELGPLPDGVNPFERCNLWLLEAALAASAGKLKFITLWNGQGGDGPGGTAHMKAEVERRAGQVVWLNTRALFGQAG